MTPRSRLATCLLASVLLTALAPAALQASGADPFAPEQVGALRDDIALARLAEEAGDAVLRARLLSPTERRSALLAVLASPYARAPEGLLVPLAALACGRDPVLAPAAGRALFTAASQLSAAALGAREVLRVDLGQAREALQCAAAAPVPRADIVAWLAMAGSALDVLLR